jgi:DNA-binding LytR/AlgR family response regulator
MLKCIIIDDEEPARLLLNDYCSKIEDIEVVGMYKSPLKAISILENGDVDMLLLDINMPDISGIDFLKTLHRPPKVIFTTAYREYAIEGFNLEAVDYLLKPIEFFRFIKAINKVRQLNIPFGANNNSETLTGSIQLKSNKKLYKIDLKEIVFIKSQSEYVMYHTQSHGKLMVYGTMKAVSEDLPISHFLRIHRSYIVNRSFVQYMEGNQIIVLKGERLPLGERYKEKFMEKW